MDIIILDLEWNAAYSKKAGGFINEIIEFGAVKCSPTLQEISEFSSLVKPRVGKRMNRYTADLTHLSLSQLQESPSFSQVLRKFTAWAGNSLVMTWGPSDIPALLENCKVLQDRDTVPFLYRYRDLQHYAQQRMGASMKDQMGLARAAEELGLDVSGMAHHRALDDSRMALEILRRVGAGPDLFSGADVCDDEFYRRVTFKTTPITDPEDPALAGVELTLACPKCGGVARRTSRWGLRNKSLRAEFKCRQCGHPFGGRFTVKKKYEGLSVSARSYAVPIIESPRALTPGPLGALRLEDAGGVGVLRFPPLESQGVNAAFTTRIGGVSRREFAAMNLGANRGDAHRNVRENYRLFCAAAGFDPESLVTGAQDHHTEVLRVDGRHRGMGVWRDKEWESIDGLVTDDPAVTLVVFCADCVPLYFVDPDHPAIGLAHAGWRGTVAGMASVMVRRLADEFGSDPSRLRVAIGPSISRESFEVDAPVAQEFLALPESEHFVTGPAPNREGDEKYHVDLWECNRRFLLRAGVLPEHIAVSGVDTVENSDLLFSHRKTQGRRGSNCAFLSLSRTGERVPVARIPRTDRGDSRDRTLPSP